MNDNFLNDMDEDREGCRSNLNGAIERQKLASNDVKYWREQYDATLTVTARLRAEAEAEAEAEQ